MNSINNGRAIIIGHTGQDGSLLLSDLEQRGWDVIGIGRSSVYHSGQGRFSGRNINIVDSVGVQRLVEDIKPNEIYYLAASHTSSQENEALTPADAFSACHDVHVKGLINILDSIRRFCPNSRLFYASTSLVFSGENGEVQNEKTPLTPSGFYAITKVQGMWLCKEYRERFGVFASTGILYNHESHLRNQNFLSQKIIRSAIRISDGSTEKLVVGDLSARVDWGYAPDYVDAFQRILKIDDSSDFIVASGKAHSVQEFVETAFSYFDLQWKDHVVEDKNILMRRLPVKIGDNNKLYDKTSWKYTKKFGEMVKQLILDTQNAMSL